MPSRKIISILILASALVTGIILASGKNSTQSNREQVVALKTPEVKLSAQNVGDWKKDLSVLPASNNISTTSNETLTDQVGQSLVANYLALKQQGTLDSDSAQTLIDQTEKFIDNASQSKYTSANIVISNDNSAAAIKTYGSAVGSALKINTPSQPKNEGAIFVEMIKNKDADLAEDLRDIARVYGNIAGSLLKIPVPSSLSSMHLKTINSLQGLAESVDTMSRAQEDPLKSLQGINLYSTSHASFVESLSEIKMGINRKGVIYKQGEGGYYLFFGI
jgi:hypothetical protein